MQQVRVQNVSNESGVQTYRLRTYDDCDWKEVESLTKGVSFYTNGAEKASFKRPKELERRSFTEQRVQYSWQSQTHPLQPTEPTAPSSEHGVDSDNDGHSRSFMLRSNSYPIRLNENAYLAYYRIEAGGVINNSNNRKCPSLSPTDITKIFRRFAQKQMIEQYFDNHIVCNQDLLVFVTKERRAALPNKVELPRQFHRDYTFILQLKLCESLCDLAMVADDDDDAKNVSDELELSQERRVQLFGAIVSAVVSAAGFKFIRFHNAKGWFPTNDAKLNRVLPVYHQQHKRRLQQIGVLRGFDAKICLNRSTGLSVKVVNSNKIIHQQNVGQELREMYERDPNGYQHNVQSIIGRKALYLPNQHVIQIASVEFEKDENSSYTVSKDGKQVVTTHKQSLLEKKVVGYVKREQYGLIANEKGYSFCPQFVHLLFDNELSVTENKDALQYLRSNVDKELESAQQFVEHIIEAAQKQSQLLFAQSAENDDNDEDGGDGDGSENMFGDDADDYDGFGSAVATVSEPVKIAVAAAADKMDILSLIDISPQPFKVKARLLPTMQLAFKRNTHSYLKCSEQDVGHEWVNIHGVIKAPAQPIHALLVGQYRLLQILHTLIKDYFNKRKFDVKLIDAIEEYVPNNIWDVAELERYIKNNKRRFGLVIVVIPFSENAAKGSLFKRQIHRLCIEHDMRSQCITDDRLQDRKKTRSIVYGMMSDSMYKVGVTTYKMCPNLQLRQRLGFDLNDTMFFGLDVCHPTKIKSTLRPSIVVLTSLYGDIFSPNVHQQKSAMHLNNNLVEISSYKAIRLMTENVVRQQFARNNVQHLPANIVMFRDGVSESQFGEMISKELTAVKRAISDLRQCPKLQKKFKDIGKWKPSITWILTQKRILDRFSVDRSDAQSASIRLDKHSPCFLVTDGLMSGDFYEFIMQIGQRTPKKYIFMSDPLGIQQKSCLDVAHFLYALHWLYPPCIPFSQGCLNYPAPIKFADHYATMWQDFITQNDQSLHDLKTSPHLHYPLLVFSDSENENVEVENETQQ